MYLRTFGDGIAVSAACAFLACAFTTPVAFSEDGPQTNVTTTSPANSSQPQEIRYQLVNVTIPTDNPLQHDPDTSKPPKLFIVLKRNGKTIGESTGHKGWSVDFEQTEKRDVNVWPIRQGTTDRYTVEVWDENWWIGYWRDHMVFNVTGLSAKDFDETIFERGSKLVGKELQATIKFEKVDDSEQNKGTVSPK